MYERVFYYEKADDGFYYEYAYNPETQTWSKAENSYVAMVFDMGVADALGEEAYAYMSNIDNWTFDEETGAYELMDYSYTFSGNTVVISQKIKFKGGHIVETSSKMDDGVWETSTYTNHGTTSVTLPVVEDPAEE